MTDEAWTYAQQSVLGSCLIDSRAIGAVLFELSEDDFQDVNRTIFTIIREKYTTGKPVDPVSVLDELGGSQEYRKYIVDLMDITPTAANVKTYAAICREKSKVSRFRELGEQLAAVESAKDAAELISSVNHIQVGRGMQFWTLAEAYKDYFANYGKKTEYLPWNLDQLNGQIDMEFGDFCLLGGRPSAGKSAFSLEAALYWGVVRGYRVGFYSNETNRKKLRNRMMAASARLNLKSIKHKNLSQKEMEILCAVAGRTSDAPIDLIESAGKTVSEIQAFALERRHQIIIVDYLQIIADGGKDEYTQVSNISKKLHVMCQSLNITCLALCQLTRTKGARPSLEDLRSSGQLEQDADIVLFLHKPDGKEDQRELIIAKNKEGECRTTLLHFDGPTQHFSYLGRGDQPMKGVDYGTLQAVQPKDDSYDQLPMDTAVPFEH